MSEYLSKKAVLEWLNENIKDQDWPHEIRYAFKHVREKIQSGVFDADDLIDDRIDEICPKCGADMLGNKGGYKWCSLVGCDYSINAPEKVGTEEWLHKYFGAERPKVEGDGNDA